MSSDFTKSEVAEFFKQFHYILGGKYTKEQWERFMQLKKAERWKAEIEELEADGYLEAFQDERGEWRYAPTEKGLASPKAPQLERIGS